MNNMKLIMESWRTNVLSERVFGAQAFVYHGSETSPDVMIPRLANDEFIPGQGAGAMYGKGIYTVYDENHESNTFSGEYGDWVYKLKINLHGYIIFDQDICEKVYGKKMSPMEQLKMLGYNEVVQKIENEVDKFYDIPEKDSSVSDPMNTLAVLRRGEDPKKYKEPFYHKAADFISTFFTSKRLFKSKYVEPVQQEEGEKLWTSKDAKDASKLLSKYVKGIVFTGRNDGKVAVAYDPGTVVPVAWSYTLKPIKMGAIPNYQEEYKSFPVWKSADLASIKKSMSRAVTKDFIPGRYNKEE